MVYDEVLRSSSSVAAKFISLTMTLAGWGASAVWCVNRVRGDRLLELRNYTEGKQ